MIWNIIGLILSLIILALILFLEKKEHGENWIIWCTIAFSFFALGSLFSIREYNIPTAIDVYRGKTTLEIAYRDSVAVDSVVVYKVR